MFDGEFRVAGKQPAFTDMIKKSRPAAPMRLASIRRLHGFAISEHFSATT